MRTLSFLFGKSPFGPLQEHMKTVARAASDLPALFEAFAEGDQAKIAELRGRIAGVEAEADRMKESIRDNLPRKLFLPVDRRDLLDMLEMQDQVANAARGCAERVFEREWDVPTEVGEALHALVLGSVAVVDAAAQAMSRLDELLEVGFAGPEAELARERIAEVVRLKDEDRAAFDRARRALFKNEGELSPLEAILMLQLFDRVADLARFSKKACSRLRLLIAA